MIYDIISITEKVGSTVLILLMMILSFILLATGKIGKVEIGKGFKLSSVEEEAAKIKERISRSSDDGDKSTNQYTLLQEYHAQGLAQAKISFWFSLIFASIGFFIIVLSIAGLFNKEVNSDLKQNVLIEYSKQILSIVAGTIIDAVAGLFFVQSNKARQLMTNFFDKLRIDRKLEESLILLSKIKDDEISSKLHAFMAINFAEINVESDIFNKIINKEKKETI